ncbi:MAG: serine hydrolase [Oscillospiraceae bacterium]|nr:serine hydrolase [Oscillospiraceae bacterium]
MIRFISIVLCIWILLGISIFANEYDPPKITKATYWYLYNINNDRVMETSPNETYRIYPASTVKIMTAIIALEYYGTNITKEITVTAEPIRRITGNNIRLRNGEVTTAEALINAVIVGGSNDATNVLAYDIAGGIAEFVVLMNEKARNIGCTNTVYTNPTGLHDDRMYTTLADMAKISLYAYRLSRFMEMASQRVYDMPPTNVSRSRPITNRNLFVTNHLDDRYYNPEAMGMNAGYTTQAGDCLITVVNHGGLIFLCIVTGAQRDEENTYSYIEAQRLLEWAYTTWDYITVLEDTSVVCEAPVKLSNNADTIAFYPQYKVELFLPINTDVEKDVDKVFTMYETEYSAPIESGMEGGLLSLYYKGELVSRVPLVTKNHVDESRAMYFSEFAGNIVSARWFWTTAGIAAVVITCYIFVNAALRYNRQKRKQMRKKTK